MRVGMSVSRPQTEFVTDVYYSGLSQSKTCSKQSRARLHKTRNTSSNEPTTHMFRLNRLHENTSRILQARLKLSGISVCTRFSQNDPCCWARIDQFTMTMRAVFFSPFRSEFLMGAKEEVKEELKKRGNIALIKMWQNCHIFNKLMKNQPKYSSLKQ